MCRVLTLSPLDGAGARLEERLYEHLDWSTPPRPRAHEVLGDLMTQAGMELGTNTPYGQCASVVRGGTTIAPVRRKLFLLSAAFSSRLNNDCVFFCVCAGTALLRCGEAQKQLGEADKKFVQSANIHFLTPLRRFSAGEYRVIQVTPERVTVIPGFCLLSSHIRVT